MQVIIETPLHINFIGVLPNQSSLLLQLGPYRLGPVRQILEFAEQGRTEEWVDLDQKELDNGSAQEERQDEVVSSPLHNFDDQKNDWHHHKHELKQHGEA